MRTRAEGPELRWIHQGIQYFIRRAAAVRAVVYLEASLTRMPFAYYITSSRLLHRLGTRSSEQ